jgi:hypothetical protein
MAKILPEAQGWQFCCLLEEKLYYQQPIVRWEKEPEIDQFAVSRLPPSFKSFSKRCDGSRKFGKRSLTRQEVP